MEGGGSGVCIWSRSGLGTHHGCEAGAAGVGVAGSKGRGGEARLRTRADTDKGRHRQTDKADGQTTRLSVRETGPGRQGWFHRSAKAVAEKLACSARARRTDRERDGDRQAGRQAGTVRMSGNEGKGQGNMQ